LVLCTQFGFPVRTAIFLRYCTTHGFRGSGSSCLLFSSRCATSRSLYLPLLHALHGLCGRRHFTAGHGFSTRTPSRTFGHTCRFCRCHRFLLHAVLDTRCWFWFFATASTRFTPFLYLSRFFYTDTCLVLHAHRFSFTLPCMLRGHGHSPGFRCLFRLVLYSTHGFVRFHQAFWFTFTWFTLPQFTLRTHHAHGLPRTRALRLDTLPHTLPFVLHTVWFVCFLVSFLAHTLSSLVSFRAVWFGLPHGLPFCTRLPGTHACISLLFAPHRAMPTRHTTFLYILHAHASSPALDIRDAVYHFFLVPPLRSLGLELHLFRRTTRVSAPFAVAWTARSAGLDMPSFHFFLFCRFTAHAAARISGCSVRLRLHWDLHAPTRFPGLRLRRFTLWFTSRFTVYLHSHRYTAHRAVYRYMGSNTTLRA